jgi:hypothetical protein
LLCLFVFGGKAEGQTTAPKSELGVHFSALAINDPTNDFLISCQSCDTFVYTGIGGRFTYNLNDSLAIDSELNFFTRENRKNTSRVVGGKPIEGLFGLKVGKRFERAGVFGKVRPGFLSFSHTISSGLGGIGTPFSRRTHLAVDVGGVFELYPSHKVLVRVDVGDTIIRYGEENVEGGLIPVVNASTRHSLQFSAGVGYRF